MGLKAWLGPPANLAGKKESVASDLIGGVARLREKAAKLGPSFADGPSN
jgi:hypothetical protein